jgi:hypothetical protein
MNNTTQMLIVLILVALAAAYGFKQARTWWLSATGKATRSGCASGCSACPAKVKAI